MDRNRVDTLVRTVAERRSRRQLLHGLAAAGASAFAIRLGVRTTAAQVVTEDSGEACTKDSDCMPAEPDPCTGAFCDFGSCSYTSVACIPGYVCCGNGECCRAESGAPSSVVIDGESHANETGIGEPDCEATHPTE